MEKAREIEKAKPKRKGWLRSREEAPLRANVALGLGVVIAGAMVALSLRVVLYHDTDPFVVAVLDAIGGVILLSLASAAHPSEPSSEGDAE